MRGRGKYVSLRVKNDKEGRIVEEIDGDSFLDVFGREL
jgi:hypothetical protein